MVIFNGQSIDDDSACISVKDKALWFNVGVYESIKVVQGHSFFGREHIGRLYNSAAVLKINLKYTESEVLSWVNKLIDVNKLKDALIRVIAFADTKEDQDPKIYMFSLGLTFYPNKNYSQGVRVITIEAERFLPKAKSLSLLPSYFAYNQAHAVGALDAIMVNGEKKISEGTRSNIFIVKGDSVISPPSDAILDGVVRQQLIKLLKDNEIKYVEKPISLDDLYNSDECFISSSSMQVMPVVKIDNKEVSDGKVGVLTRRIVKLYKDFERSNI